MNAAICDDERVQIKELKRLLRKQHLIEDVSTFESMDELWQSIEEGCVYNLIFMDIEWPGDSCNGMEHAERLTKLMPETKIIFITGYVKEYFQKVFLHETNLCGFLVKPIQAELLKQLVTKTKQQLDEEQKDGLVLHTRKATYNICYNNILYLESDAHKVIVHTKGRQVEVYEKLEEVQKRLPEKLFLHCHKSYLLNMKEISCLEGTKIVMKNGARLPISRMRKNAVKEKYFSFLRNTL